jgi:hypothetical protein
MATAAVQLDEESLIREQVAKINLPAGIRFLRIEQVADWTGEETWRITFSVAKKIPLTKQTLSELQLIRKAVREALSTLPLHRWTFVRFTEGK